MPKSAKSPSPAKTARPSKPRPDYPLFPHASGQWAKKVAGRTRYFGPWSDPQGALARYLAECEPATTPAAPRVAKPYPDFPLTAHPRGQWCKRIKGRLRYFGAIEDWQGALARYQAERDDLHAGREPQPPGAGLTLRELVNEFLHDRLAKAKTGELQHRTVEDDATTFRRLLTILTPEATVASLGPRDFAELRASLAQNRGPVSLGNDITRIRVLLKHAADNHQILIRYGSSFKKPSAAVLRKDRASKGARMFKAKEIRLMLREAPMPLRAMLLLGANAGFGVTDCARLTKDKLDLDRGWLDFPRPKTGIDRRCPLWPETVRALREAIEQRPAPKDDALADRVFLTSRGNSWDRKESRNPIPNAVAKLLKRLGIKRPGLGFYALRHGFQTIAEESGDVVATAFIMGHAPRSDDMAAVYRERLTDRRLYRVVKYVRRWLFRKRKAAGRHSGESSNNLAE